MDINALTPKQQASEAVRQAENILISTGQFPSVDQVAATLALAQILRKLGKKVTAIVSDQIPTQAAFLSTVGLDKTLGGQRDFILKISQKRTQADGLKYTVEDGFLNVHITPLQGGYAPSDVTFAYGAYHYDVAIVLGVPTRARLDRVFSENPEIITEIPLINLDFHRSNELYGAVNLIDTNAASLCEMLVALSESLQTGLIDEEIATALLTGIIASTDRFTAAHTTPKALTVAAQMMAIGAKQQTVIRGLYKSGESRSDNNRDKDGRGGSGPSRGGRDPRPGHDDRSGASNPYAPSSYQPIATEPPPSEPIVTVVAPSITTVSEVLATPAEVVQPVAAVETVVNTPSEVKQETVVIPEAPTEPVIELKSPLATPEAPTVQKTVAAAVPNRPQLVDADEPHLFFKGHGSVLANLPDDDDAYYEASGKALNDPFGSLAAA